MIAYSARLLARQLEFERLRSEMDQCLGCGCVSLSVGLVINPGDGLAAEGEGARRLLPIALEHDPARIDR